jgi:hypothetical protein
MSAFADLIGSKEFLAALAVLAVGGVFTAAIKWYRDNRDGKKIYTFLLQSKTGTEWTFRSTQAISSHTKISESRVEAICSKHPKIKRNEKEKQSWKLTG